MDKKYVEGIFNGLFLIGIGIIFLLNTTGVLPWSIWGQIFRFWPVFIIIGGLQIIAGKSALGHAIVGAISLLLLGVFVVFAANSVQNPNGSWAWPFTEIATVTKQTVLKASDFSDVTSVEVKLDMSAGEFKLTESNNDDYFKLDATYSEGRGEPEVVAEQSNGDLSINVDQSSTNWNGMMWMWPGNKLSYDMKLGDTKLPTDFDFDLSAGSLDAVLAQTLIRSMKVDVSAGTAVIKLSEDAIPTRVVDVNVSAGSLTLSVPKGVGLKVTYNVTAGSVEIDGKDVERGNGATEIDADAEKVVELDLNVSAGSVEIKRV